MKPLMKLRRSATDADLRELLHSLPYVHFLGIDAQRRGDELTFTLPFKDDLVGNTRLPALHGGAIGAFLETAAIVQMVWQTEAAVLPKTIDFSIEYLRSGRALDTFARAHVTKVGRRVGNVRVEAWQQEQQRPIAAGYGHFLLTPAGDLEEAAVDGS